MSKKVFDTIKTGINNGIYQNIRLIKKHDTGENEVLIPYNRVGHTSQAELNNRFEHIKLQLEKKLGAGEYVIECNTGNRKGSLKDSFNVSIKVPVMLPISTGEKKEEDKIINKTGEQETMREIEFDEYISIIKENEQLKAENKLLVIQLAQYEKAFPNGVHAPLNDSNQNGSSISEKFINALGDTVPSVIGILSQVLDQRDRQIKLKERELDFKQYGKKKIMSAKPKINYDKVVEEFEKLYNEDPETFEVKMDELEESNPELYEYVCNSLGIEYDEQEYDSEEQE